jgi:hypothetical protein
MERERGQQIKRKRRRENTLEEKRCERDRGEQSREDSEKEGGEEGRSVG